MSVQEKTIKIFARVVFYDSNIHNFALSSLKSSNHSNPNANLYDCEVLMPIIAVVVLWTIRHCTGCSYKLIDFSLDYLINIFHFAL